MFRPQHMPLPEMEHWVQQHRLRKDVAFQLQQTRPLDWQPPQDFMIPAIHAPAQLPPRVCLPLLGIVQVSHLGQVRNALAQALLERIGVPLRRPQLPDGHFPHAGAICVSNLRLSATQRQVTLHIQRHVTPVVQKGMMGSCLREGGGRVLLCYSWKFAHLNKGLQCIGAVVWKGICFMLHEACNAVIDQDNM